MQIAILCGGRATRLYPLTKEISKSMIEIEGKPFLEHQIELLRKNGIKDIILCVGYKSGQIKNYFKDGKKFRVNIRYSYDGKKLMGTGGALKKAERFLKAIKFFKNFNKLGMMVVYKNLDKYELSNVEVKGNLVEAYSKKNKTRRMKYIDYGVSIFKKEALKFVPKNQVYDLSKLSQILIKKKQLLAYPAERRFYQIGSSDGLTEFKEYAKRCP